METQTFVIKRKTNEEGKSKTYYFHDFRFGIPAWGDIKEAKTFTAKEDANKYLPSLRHRRTRFGNHYMKGIKVVELFRTGKLNYTIEKNKK